MTRIVKKMPTPMGSAPSQTASVQLPLGLTYERLYIAANVNIASGGAADVPVASWGDVLDEIRLIVDGDTKIQVSGADLVALNQFYGIEMVAGVLPLFLSRPWMRTPNGEDQTAYGTAGGMASFSLEMDIKAVTSVDSLSVFAEQSAGRPFGPHYRLQRFVHNQGVTGEAEISDIPRGSYAMLAMHFDTADIGTLEVLADQRKVLDTNENIRDARHKIIKRAPQTGYTHVDFLTENRLGEALPMALQDFRIKPNFSATGNFSLYAESIQGRN